MKGALVQIVLLVSLTAAPAEAFPSLARLPSSITSIASGISAPVKKQPIKRKRHVTKTQVRSRTVKRRQPTAASQAAALRAKTAAITKVAEEIGEPTNAFLEQPGALIPFFEQLYRQEHHQGNGPVRILQFGDSHTAAHYWPSEIRSALQSRFGDGGSGFIHAGKPWVGYRRFDVSVGASAGWITEGLVGRSSQRGDEFQGLSGVSVHTSRPGAWISLETSNRNLEIQYFRQPGGGSFLLYDNDEFVAEQSTDGEPGPGILEFSTTEGPHTLRIVTKSSAPVKLYGWIAEEPGGVTYEPLGISGANASITTRWNTSLFQQFLTRRDPALIVVAYGANEAGQLVWTYEKYFEEFDSLLRKIRAASPTASILVVGPPDRLWRERRTGWKAAPRMDVVIRAQRDAAKANRAAFWDTQTRMGGSGSIRDWTRAGLATQDYVHFSADGYRRLGDVLYQDLMVQYNEFKTFRNDWSASSHYDRTATEDPQSDQQGHQEE